MATGDGRDPFEGPFDEPCEEPLVGDAFGDMVGAFSVLATVETNDDLNRIRRETDRKWTQSGH